MRAFSCAVSLLFVAGIAAGQAPGVTVSLTTMPYAIYVEETAALTATVRTPGMGVLKVGEGTYYERDRIRLTFRAQKTWPCPETIVLAEVAPNGGTSTLIQETHTYTFSWPPNFSRAGEYVLSVDASYLTRLTRERLGSATIARYIVRPRLEPGAIQLRVAPPSGEPVSFPAPVDIKAWRLNGQGNRWRFKFNCNKCTPAWSDPIDGAIENINTFAKWQTTAPAAGAYLFAVYVDKIQISGCVWIATDYNYDADHVFTTLSP